MANIIRDYCIIRDKKIIHGGNMYFQGAESQAALFFTEAYKHGGFNYPKYYKMDMLSRLGFLAAEFLLEGKNIFNQYKGDEIGIILYNSSSSLDTDRVHQQSIQNRAAYFPSPSVFVYTLANIVTGEICIRHKIFGESTFFITEKFDIPVLHEYVSQLLESDVVKCCIAGWLEVNNDHYDAMLYLIEKGTSDTDGIAIFEPQKLREIYLQQI